MQLELDLNHSDAAQLRVADQASQAKLTRSSGLTYCWHAINGHQDWADHSPPSTEDLNTLAQYMLDNPEWWGCRYSEVLTMLLLERAQVLSHSVVDHVIKDSIHYREETHLVFQDCY